MLTLRIANIFTSIEGDIDLKLLTKLERELSFRPQGFVFSPAYNRWIKDANGNQIKRAWNGWKPQFWSSNRNGTYFPTGLISKVTDLLTKENVKFCFQDTRDKPLPNLNISLSEELQFRDYQTRVIHTACKKSRGIIQAATGAGKTLMAAGIIEKLKVSPFLFFVTSIDLLEQAKESFEEFLTQNGSKLKVGQLGGGIIDIQDVNVCTIQTVVRALDKKWDKTYKFDADDGDDKTSIDQYKDDIRDLIRHCKGAICDEIQHWKADTCRLVARELKSAYYTFGTSATPYRDEGDDMLIQACFGKKIEVITATELIEHPDKYLVRPYIKMVHIKGKPSKFRHYQSIYQDRVTDNEYYNECIANIANAYISKDRLVLVLVQRVEHGKEIASRIKGAEFLSGGSTKEKRRAGLNNLRSRSIRCIVSTSIFDEGIDVRPLDTVILAGQGKSPVRAMQRVGRICRPFTYPDGSKKLRGTVIDPVISDRFLSDHAKQREKMYRTEPAYNIEHIEEAP